jgi:hypothetical protein
MSIQGLNNNSFFNLNNIRTLAGGSSSSSASSKSGGSFDLGNSGTTGSSVFGGSDVSDAGTTGPDIGNVGPRDSNVDSALNSVAGESAIQQQFRNQLALVNLQERVQSQSRTVEILTNILKARHDAALSAARNVK